MIIVNSIDSGNELQFVLKRVSSRCLAGCHLQRVRHAYSVLLSHFVISEQFWKLWSKIRNFLPEIFFRISIKNGQHGLHRPKRKNRNISCLSYIYLTSKVLSIQFNQGLFLLGRISFIKLYQLQLMFHSNSHV